MRIPFFYYNTAFHHPEHVRTKGISSELTGRQVGGYLIYR